MDLRETSSNNVIVQTDKTIVRSVILTFLSVCFSKMTSAYLSKLKSNYVFFEFKLTKS